MLALSTYLSQQCFQYLLVSGDDADLLKIADRYETSSWEGGHDSDRITHYVLYATTLARRTSRQRQHL